jgi:hypothetical protein
MEHLIPKREGGIFTPSNLTVACFPCNNARGTYPFWHHPPVLNFDWDKTIKFSKLLKNYSLIRILNLTKSFPTSNILSLKDLIQRTCSWFKLSSPDLSSMIEKHNLSPSWDEPTSPSNLKRICQTLILILNKKSL